MASYELFRRNKIASSAVISSIQSIDTKKSPSKDSPKTSAQKNEPVAANDLDKVPQKEILLKLVSCGYRSENVEIKRAIATILRQVWNA